MCGITDIAQADRTWLLSLVARSPHGVIKDALRDGLPAEVIERGIVAPVDACSGRELAGLRLELLGASGLADLAERSLAA